MDQIDSLVPDSSVAREFNITLMTVWRWDRDPRVIADGWPPKIKIGAMNYRSRDQIELFKAKLKQRALAARATVLVEAAAP